MGNHIPCLQSVKDYIGKCFAMKDLREATFILGIKIYRDRSKRLIVLGQNAYMDKFLKRYKMDNSKCGHIHMQERLDLNKTQGASTPKEVNRMKNVPYASAVGSIMYVVRCTRPDVAFAQNITSRFQQNPGELHWTAVKNILKFETDRDDTKSQTGYVFILNGGAVDWKSSKQSTTAMSATEAEYIAASEAAMEAVWIRKFISKLVPAGSVVPTGKDNSIVSTGSTKVIPAGRTILFLTFQLFRHNALHAKAVEEKLEAFSSECFNEDIRRLISSLDKVELNNLILNLFFYKMVLNCDMLRPRVLNGVARLGNGTLGVAVQWDFVEVKSIVS
ncbi:hypothetical protein Tco_1466101 [Tanacetum coccineum]